mmetsp:Transcript_14828/g.34208  ORF Transcript_14828/g.34208 Transcript_14828/m.34208 type:complete len:284 (-) Transcript_14828:103-954(-)
MPRLEILHKAHLLVLLKQPPAPHFCRPLVLLCPRAPNAFLQLLEPLFAHLRRCVHLCGLHPISQRTTTLVCCSRTFPCPADPHLTRIPTSPCRALAIQLGHILIDAGALISEPMQRLMCPCARQLAHHPTPRLFLYLQCFDVLCECPLPTPLWGLLRGCMGPGGDLIERNRGVVVPRSCHPKFLEPFRRGSRAPRARQRHPNDPCFWLQGVSRDSVCAGAGARRGDDECGRRGKPPGGSGRGGGVGERRWSVCRGAAPVPSQVRRGRLDRGKRKHPGASPSSG